MLTCENCKLILEPNTVYCPRCGRNLLPGQRKSYQAPDPQTRSLLMEASRLKGKSLWDEAVDKCMDALKREPECPDVYAALGEIYEAQGRFDQALQWFQMADAEFAAVGKPVLELQEKIRALNSRRAAAHQTTGWFDRFVGGSRFSSSMRILTTAMVGFLALLVLGAVFVIYQDNIREQRMNVPRKRLPQSTSSSEGKPAGGESSAAATGVRTPGTTPVIINRTEQPPEQTPEQQLTAALAHDPAVAGRRLAINEVVIDPRHRQIIVQFKVSPTDGAPSRSRILADSAAVCSAAYRANADALFVTVYALAEVPGDGLTRLFVADTNRQSAANADPAAPVSELEKLFLNPWWNPQITPA